MWIELQLESLIPPVAEHTADADALHPQSLAVSEGNNYEQRSEGDLQFLFQTSGGLNFRSFSDLMFCFSTHPPAGLDQSLCDGQSRKTHSGRMPLVTVAAAAVMNHFKHFKSFQHCENPALLLNDNNNIFVSILFLRKNKIDKFRRGKVPVLKKLMDI